MRLRNDAGLLSGGFSFDFSHVKLIAFYITRIQGNIGDPELLRRILLVTPMHTSLLHAERQVGTCLTYQIENHCHPDSAPLICDLREDGLIACCTQISIYIPCQTLISRTPRGLVPTVGSSRQWS